MTEGVTECKMRWQEIELDSMPYLESDIPLELELISSIPSRDEGLSSSCVSTDYALSSMDLEIMDDLQDIYNTFVTELELDLDLGLQAGEYELYSLKSTLESKEAEREDLIKIHGKRKNNEAHTSEALVETLAKRNRHLSSALIQRAEHFQNIHAMLSLAPVNDLRLALMTPLETFIHLGRNHDDRRQTLAFLRNAKLETAAKYLQSKAQGIDLNVPFRNIDSFEKFGILYTSCFATARIPGVSVKEANRVCHQQIFELRKAMIDVCNLTLSTEPIESDVPNFLQQKSLFHCPYSAAGQLDTFESNGVSYSQQENYMGIFTTDYIDVDDLHPPQQDSRIRNDIVVALLVEPYYNLMTGATEGVELKSFRMLRAHLRTYKEAPYFLEDHINQTLTNIDLVDRSLVQRIQSLKKPTSQSSKLSVEDRQTFENLGLSQRFDASMYPFSAHGAFDTLVN